MVVFFKLVTLLVLRVVSDGCLSRFSFGTAHLLWPCCRWTALWFSTLAEIWPQLHQYLLYNSCGV